jgi:pilus assembly protein CpaB
MPRSSHPRRELPALPPHARRRLRAIAWKFRYGFSAACLGAAVAVTVHQLSPPPLAVVSVVVADGALPAGTALTAADVRLVEVPPSALPSDAFATKSDIEGRSLAVGVSDGTLLSSAVLVAADPAGSGPPGTVVTAIRLAEPALAHIVSPGMFVDLLAPSNVDSVGSSVDGLGAVPAEVVARRAVVLPLPHADGTAASNGAFSVGSATDDPLADLLLVAVTPEEAALLASVTAWSAVSAVVVQ